MIQFALAKASDLKKIARLEAEAFPVDLTRTLQEMQGHLAAYPETFWVAKDYETVAGYILGPTGKHRYLDDSVLQDKPNDPAAKFQWVLSLVVAPAYRGQGLGSQLLTLFTQQAKLNHRQAVSLTCLSDLVTFYEQNGFVNEGRSGLVQGQDILFNLVKYL
ncbi:MAG: GNAT family N-acetyltransferase [Lactobacillus sp.]|jgi:ribosomal protein S18 acetylase RimI-like enzyme|nr:GNAT family N-acetyltransferase [Lactobacillus sp.]MCH3906356.1 GNAT family N-acetyltransferase [Lactobacillus sp.]MCH3990070.1 GNAT family N-acetyltransferase [Lactobacillus sp.]MCH4069216.1 GNAT family N-acetyltransferase [Lactobacillus sp.]MCI1303518.1 GNAT family N-acetyltransferase [Lactobacillus sp.]